MSKIAIAKTKNYQLFAALAAGGALFCAVALGAGIVLVGADSSLKILTIGAAATALLGAVAYLAADLPLLVFVRFAFVLSFFFKGEINILKINEVEDPSGLNFSLTLGAGLILLLYDWLENEDATPKLPTTFALLFGALFVCAAVSVVYGTAGLLGWFSLFSLATSIFVAYVVASHFARRERLRELIIAVACGLLLTGATAFSQSVLDFPKVPFFGTGTEDEMLGTQSLTLSRVAGFLRTPTEMAWIVSTLLPLVLASLVGAVKDFDWRRKILFSAAAVAGIAAIILSLARGSWFSFLAALGILLIGGWLQMTPRERNARILPAGAAFLAAMLLLVPFAGKIYERLTADDEGSAQIRLTLLEVAERMIADNPLVGVGLNNYRDTMTRYDETGIFVSQAFPNPVHNMFAHVTAETGVAAGIIFCLLIAAAFYENWRGWRDQDRLLSVVALAIFAGLVAFVISAFKEPGSLGSTRPPMRTLFFLFGLTLAVSRLRSFENSFKKTKPPTFTNEHR